jgi:putative ABC transport system substrate-binding protein
MKRRDFITLLGGAAAAWPLAGWAQQSERMQRLGVLMNSVESDSTGQSYVGAFAQALRKLGWVDGKNLHIDWRWRAGGADQARAYAAELVGLAPDVILSSSTMNLAALQRVTRTIPIVFVQVSDPVAQGFVSSLARPGGNITGFSGFEFSIGGKWVDLLKQIDPALSRVAVIFNPETSPQSKLWLSSIEAAAPSFGVQPMVRPVHDTADIEHVIADFSRQPNCGLIFPTDSFTLSHRGLIAELAARYRLPAIYPNREFVEAGGLMRYGSIDADQFRQAAIYVDRIFKGMKAADLPIQQATKFELVISLKAARALGIELPLSLLMRADEVIE